MANSVYSATSAYAAQFYGLIENPQLRRAWDVKAEGKLKFFPWLILQNRVWTADRLAARGWPHDDICSLCDQEMESVNHLLLQCPFAKEVWFSFNTSHPFSSDLALRCTSISGWWKRISTLQRYQEERSPCDDLHGSVHGLAFMEGEEQEDLRGTKG